MTNDLEMRALQHSIRWGAGGNHASMMADFAAAEVARARALPAQGEPAAIFQECAEIAMEHVDNGKWDDPELYGRGYDQACRDIAEAIKLRAANRKTMDAIADATLLKP